jgi:predicted small secreted protein
MLKETEGFEFNGRRCLMAMAVVGMTLGGLTACNTVEGAGKDIEATGEAIQESADD